MKKGLSLNKNALNVHLASLAAHEQQHQSLKSRIPRINERKALGENNGPLKPSQQHVVPIIPEPVKNHLIAEPIEDIDKSTSRDAIFSACDIAKEIYDYLFALEKEQAIPQDYLKDQKIMTPRVRQRLINWCIEIHSDLKLLPETMYMTIGLIDRFFDRFNVEQQSQVQLYAIASLLIASKYEEIYPPEVADLVYLTQNAYHKRDILRAEIVILKQVNFDLGKPIPLTFLRRFSKAAHCDVKTHCVAKYLMELSLNEYECCHWQPSLVAAAALFGSLHLLTSHENATLSRLSRQASLSGGKTVKFERWNQTMVHYTHYSKHELLPAAATLFKILRKAQKSPQSYSCVKKNSQNLSKWPELKSTKVDELIKLAEQ